MMTSKTCNLGRVMTTGAAMMMMQMAARRRSSCCAPGEERRAGGAAGEKDLVATAGAAGSFGTLLAALKAAEMTEALQGAGPFTVFAPTDEAFERLAEGAVEELLKPENKDRLRNVLSHHVVSGRFLATDVIRQKSLTALSGRDIAIRVKAGKVLVDGARVLATDVNASNGTIHVIDTVLT